MNFIQNLIQQNKLKQEEAFKRDCCASIIPLEQSIEFIKKDISLFSANKKGLSLWDTRTILIDLDNINTNYSNFMCDLNTYKHQFDGPYFKYMKDELKKQIDYMLQLKKGYRKEFESIYNNFKRITKGRNLPERNEILGIMRKTFDFDSSKYHAQTHVKTHLK